MKELDTQRLLMGKGAKASIISKKGSGPALEDEDGNLKDEIVPDEGVSSGARVFVSSPSSPSFIASLLTSLSPQLEMES